MIGVIFEFVDQHIEVRVVDRTVLFRTQQSTNFSDISGIKLDRPGVIKEFPDLKDNPEWQKIAQERFKDKIKKMNTEEERIKYIIEDLTKFGYKPLHMQKQGFRPVKLN